MKLTAPTAIDRGELNAHITLLERQCESQPDNVDLHKCLEMARTMNFDLRRSSYKPEVRKPEWLESMPVSAAFAGAAIALSMALLMIE